MGVSCNEKRPRRVRISSYVIWIEPKIYNSENDLYIKELISKYRIYIKCFKNLEDASPFMKSILFKETKIIVNSRTYSQLVEFFKENINSIYFVPKIISFTNDISRFHERNPGYNDIDIFYKYGGITTIFEEVEKFLLDDHENKKKRGDELKNYNAINKAKLTFEYIDCREKLLLPMFFKTLLSGIENENINTYTNSLYNSYSKDSYNFKILLGSISSIKNIPIEILSRYYARLYTIRSNFYINLNKDLELNQIKDNLTFIKVLYEGIKLKSFSLASYTTLYLCSSISNQEIEKIKNYLENKNPNLPSLIVFSRSFLSFYKEKKQAEYFLRWSPYNSGLSKVIYILEKDRNYGYNLATHADLEIISFDERERSVLFFPFSSFEVKNINININTNDSKYKTIYEITLKYLGNYLIDIENDNNITLKENLIPESEFKKQLFAAGLFSEENIINLNTKSLYNSFKKYEREINNNNSLNQNKQIDKDNFANK